ncbi:MAG: hypothetical protein J6T48_02920 [Bacteroidales bacterium]|nr:hypothetical protein [Bacteroidales bacterium]
MANNTIIYESAPQKNENCCLYVPPQLVEQYRQHPVWGEFGKILPID